MNVHLFERLTAEFLEVLLCLLNADERAGNADINLLAALRHEADSGCRVFALRLKVLALLTFVSSRCIGEGTIELQDEVVLEAFWHAAAVASRLAHHLVLARDDLHV